jgi:hypothetical protein
MQNVRCILAFVYYCIPSGGLFVYFSFHVHVYIQASGPLMNTSAIPNMVYRARTKYLVSFYELLISSWSSEALHIIKK